MNTESDWMELGRSYLQLKNEAASRVLSETYASFNRTAHCKDKQLYLRRLARFANDLWLLMAGSRSLGATWSREHWALDLLNELAWLAKYGDAPALLKMIELTLQPLSGRTHRSRETGRYALDLLGARRPGRPSTAIFLNLAIDTYRAVFDDMQSHAGAERAAYDVYFLHVEGLAGAYDERSAIPCSLRRDAAKANVDANQAERWLHNVFRPALRKAKIELLSGSEPKTDC